MGQHTYINTVTNTFQWFQQIYISSSTHASSLIFSKENAQYTEYRTHREAANTPTENGTQNLTNKIIPQRQN